MPGVPEAERFPDPLGAMIWMRLCMTGMILRVVSHPVRAADTSRAGLLWPSRAGCRLANSHLGITAIRRIVCRLREHSHGSLGLSDAPWEVRD